MSENLTGNKLPYELLTSKEEIAANVEYLQIDRFRIVLEALAWDVPVCYYGTYFILRDTDDGRMIGQVCIRERKEQPPEVVLARTPLSTIYSIACDLSQKELAEIRVNLAAKKTLNGGIFQKGVTITG